MKFIFLSALLLVGCVPAPVPVPAVVVAPSAPVVQRKASRPWAYDQFVADHLTAAMLAADAGGLCPKYSAVDHKAFWVALVRATAYHESSYQPDNTFVEPMLDSQGNKQISRGLLQLSLDDSRNYRTPTCAKMGTVAAIFTPEINLGCGMEMMDYRIRSHSGLAIGPKPVLGAYWSTIRDNKVLPELKADMPECFKN